MVASTFYAEVGGLPFFTALVGEFYAGVRADPVLAPLYPDDEWAEAEERLRLFLVQYWGRGHDLRRHPGPSAPAMRHQPFVIGPAERDAWIAHMSAALDARALPADLDAPLRTYLVSAAHAMQNGGLSPTSLPPATSFAAAARPLTASHHLYDWRADQNWKRHAEVPRRFVSKTGGLGHGGRGARRARADPALGRPLPEHRVLGPARPASRA